jgi:glycerol-1-phosphate dehydrogenase [NAD(P)+]
MKRIEIGPDVLDLLPEAVSGLLAGDSERVVLVGDPTPIPREGKELKGLVESRFAETFLVERAVIGDPKHELPADEEALDEAEAAVSGVDCVVVVGSGTISDVCKVATSRARSMPLELRAARGQRYSSKAAPQR